MCAKRIVDMRGDESSNLVKARQQMAQRRILKQRMERQKMWKALLLQTVPARQREDVGAHTVL